MAKMTVHQIAALKPRDKAYKQNADIGLQLRVSAAGSKVWIVQYVVGGKQREYRIPRPFGPATDHAHLSLADARMEADRIRAMARAGVDFQVETLQALDAEARRVADEQSAEIRRAEIDRTENLTVLDMFDAWLLNGVSRKDDNAELRRSFAADVLPKIGAIPIKSLTEHELRAVLRAMVDRGVNRAAVMVRNSLTQMFAWAEKRQPWRKLLVDGDPMDLIEIKKIVSPDYDLDNQRDRILSSAEICELREIFARMRTEFHSAPNRRVIVRPVEQVTQCAVWIMLSTLCRVGEMSMARWEHVDLTAAEWFIPKANVKDNVADLKVYLSAFSLEQFRQLHKETGHTDWCFPGRGAERHLDVKSISKQVGDRQAMFKKAKDGSARKPMANRRHDNTLVLGGGKNGAWTPHDLRRTGATMMQSLGISLELIDRCQNHVLAGSKVRRHYLHHDYAEEKREAWRILGARLSEILA
ncbi:integrase [Massilia eurypsychrophila]|uniref:Integrase n=1 Tax=Massilia eurypsychrophila TaxID=1485217 RepID=A0A2G8T869_9BURK|nr:site-specific integrase [Massilia eurypsychrophila]PIL42231.1 integrase [Massilia eurypsychrophila]